MLTQFIPRYIDTFLFGQFPCHYDAGLTTFTAYMEPFADKIEKICAYATVKELVRIRTK